MLRYILPALTLAASLGDAAVADEWHHQRRVHRRDPGPGIDLNINLLGCKLNFALINGLCVPDCSKQPKTYLDVRANKCVACADPDATTCTANGATACGTLYLQNGKCAACPAGQFGDNASHTCKPCSAVDPDAATCSATKALSCKTLWLNQAGKCVSDCGAGFFKASDHTCKPCSTVDPDAATCDASQAFSCSTKYLKGGKCTSDCGEGFFADAASHTCKTCTDADAKTCSATQALSCKTKFLKNGACVADCGDPFYKDTINHVCAACKDPDAATCTATGATSCKTLFLKNGACVADCGNPFCQDASDHTCKACKDPDAATCDSTKALSCSTKYLKDGGCTDTCGDGFFADQSTHTCAACTDSDAATCDNMNALSCKTKYLESGHCVAKCAAGSVGDDATHTCKACSSLFPDAKECTAQGPTSCHTPGNTVVGNQCIAAVRISLYPNYLLQGGSYSDNSHDRDLTNGDPGVGRGACSTYCSGSRNTPYSYGRLETYTYIPGYKYLHCHCSGGGLGYIAPTPDVRWIATVVGDCQTTSAAEAPGNADAAAACVDAAIVNGQCERISDGSDCESFFG